jgi:hypothetical protein
MRDLSASARPHFAGLRLALLAFAVAAIVCFGVPFTRVARAAGAGNFKMMTPDVTEKNGEWHLKVRIDLPRAPAMMHAPMRFTFSKEAVDERAIMSKGAEPVHHRVVLETAQKQIVGLDVDFADASGKVFKSTYFEFDLKRKDQYFEAGEYTVALNGPDGDVGGAQRLTLKGDNPPVYRGAMEFTDKPSKKKGPKIESVSSGLDGGDQEVAQNDKPAAAAPVTGDVAPVGTASDMIPKSSYNKTAEEVTVREHPGCGCFTAGRLGGSVAGAGAAALGLALVLSRRRRRA